MGELRRLPGRGAADLRPDPARLCCQVSQAPGPGRRAKDEQGLFPLFQVCKIYDTHTVTPFPILNTSPAD